MKGAALAALSLGVLSMEASAMAQERPSIVLIVADDLGPGDLGAYGQDRIATPHIDALAERGVRFTDAYAGAPVCAPSRCSLLTGLTVPHCSASDNARPNIPLSLEETNLGLFLSAAGYRTALVGKWGLGGEMDDGTFFGRFARPERVGFDLSVGVIDQQLAELAYPFEWFRNGERVENEADGARRWLATVLIDEALAFLDDAPHEQPYFLYFAPTLPHREYRVPAIDPRYAALGWPEVEATYATMVTELDTEVGRLVDAIAARGDGERTIVVFTSDNGPNSVDGHTSAFFGSAAGRRGEKRDLYEGGVRVPLLVAGDDVTAGEVASPVALYDLLPTFAELAGASIAGIDGVSIAPALRGEALPARDAIVLAGAEGEGDALPDAAFAVRSGSLVLIRRTDGGAELYDVVADPEQRVDLSITRPDDVARLDALGAAGIAPRPIAPRPAIDVDLSGEVLTAEGEPALTPVFGLSFDPSADALASVLPRPELRLALTLGAGIAEEALALSRSPDGAARAHAVLPASPAFGMGRSSFTFAARVRLTIDEATARMTVACARPAGREERFTDWAVLARVGPLDAAASAERVDAEPWSPERIGVLMGDPTISGRGRRGAERAVTIPIISSLAITDANWHSLEVRYDAAASTLRFSLDGAVDVVPVPERVHYPSDGPLVLGACLDTGGRAEGAMVGALDDIVLARGLGALVAEDGRLPMPRPNAVELLALLGDQPPSAPPSRTFTLRIPLVDGRGRTLRVEIDRRHADAARLEVTADRELVAPGEAVTIVVTGRPGTGELDDQWIDVTATDALLGTLAAGAPLRIRFTGEVHRPPSALGWIEGGLVACVLVGGGAVLLWRRRRSTGSPGAGAPEADVHQR